MRALITNEPWVIDLTNRIEAVQSATCAGQTLAGRPAARWPTAPRAVPARAPEWTPAPAASCGP